MRVTRDVIYDLLPAYFSGDASVETKQLVDEFLSQDPEFSRMMERFRMVFRDPRPAQTAGRSDDKEVFERARGLLQKRSELRGYAIAFGLATFFVIVLGVRLVPGSGAVGLWVIAAAFAATSVFALIQLYFFRSSDRYARRLRD